MALGTNPHRQIDRLGTSNGQLTGNRYITASPDGIAIVHASSGTVTYELADAHNTATTEVAASNLAVTNRYYDPYGNPVGTTPSSWADPHAYLGQPQDTTTGLDLLGARQYDPTSGRFLSVDPVLESGDQRQMNGYSYGADNPVNGSDPNGTMYTSGPNGPDCIALHTCNDPGSGGDQNPPPKLNCQNDPNMPSCPPPLAMVSSIQNASTGDKPVPFLYVPQTADWYPQFLSEFKSFDGCDSEGHCNNASAYTISMSAVQACKSTPDCASSGYLSYFISLQEAHIGDIAGGDIRIPGGGQLMTPKQLAEYNASIADGVPSSKGPTCGGQSFAADTMVVTASGATVPISELHVGDKVVALDTATGKTHIETVDAVLVHDDTDLYDLTVETAHGKQTIHTTSDHPIWDVTARAWVVADELPVGDHLLAADGTIVTAVGGTIPTNPNGWMWDLTVDTLHDFYVVAGDTPVLVHNSDCGAYQIPLDENGMPEGGHTSGTARPPWTGGTPNSVYTRTGQDGTPVQNTIYDENGDAVGHYDFKDHGTGGPHGHIIDPPGTPGGGHGSGAPHIPGGDLPPGWALTP